MAIELPDGRSESNGSRVFCEAGLPAIGRIG